MTESGMHFIDSPEPNDRVVAVEISGELTAEDMRSLTDRFQSVVDRGEKVLLFVDMRGYKGWELGVATEKLKNIGMLWKAFERYAIVGDKRWMEIWVTIIDPLTPQEISHFTPEQTHDAWEWLLAAEASVIT